MEERRRKKEEGEEGENDDDNINFVEKIGGVCRKRTHTHFTVKTQVQGGDYHLFLNTRFFFCLNSAT